LSRKVGVDGSGPGCFTDPEDLLRHAADLQLDGVVIATPNALHAPQTLAALDRGLAVFCQKPLALSGEEARRLLAGARAADRLLGIDYTYRTLASAAELRRLVRAGALGRVWSIDAVFHNGYGPDKPWCFDPALAGGGALLDLGVHLIDLAFWLLEARHVSAVSGAVFREGRLLPPRGRESLARGEVAIDDFATARIDFEAGTGERAVASVAVSWHAHAGRDCAFRVALFGTAGGAELRNVGGSFYDFELARFTGRSEEIVARDSGESLGRGIVAWAERLAASPRFDPEAVRSVLVSDAVDAIYGDVRGDLRDDSGGGL
ncbi:MAG TPA: Gfo/Idh/MocA family oxidoreductase, partial [Thermoanaerobaculia bacterium]|nr:Gfo/Idh/MocA family oxidoreductase [Thermoanaerobaculia bacterium]